MSERQPLYRLPGEKGKRGFEDLECYQLALEVMALDSLHYYSIARGELNETLSRLIEAKVLEYITQPDFEELYKLIRQTEQTLNGYMSYVRRQRAGSQEFGDKKVREDQVDYGLPISGDNNDDK